MFFALLMRLLLICFDAFIWGGWAGFLGVGLVGFCVM